jgi:hypothetical protein
MSAEETYSLAHTARCKLLLAANRPDRNLRFLLGHAVTLDKLMLRLVEIEIESEGSSDDENTNDDLPTITNPGYERRVSFQNNAKPHASVSARNRSPPPGEDAHLDDSDEEYADDDEEEEDADELSLRRFKPTTAQPPHMVDDEDDESSDEDELASPPTIPTELELQSITAGPQSEELADLYQTVKSCPCHGHREDAPTVVKVWEVPQKPGHEGKRVAVVQLED